MEKPCQLSSRIEPVHLNCNIGISSGCDGIEPDRAYMVTEVVCDPRPAVDALVSDFTLNARTIFLVR